MTAKHHDRDSAIRGDLRVSTGVVAISEIFPLPLVQLEQYTNTGSGEWLSCGRGETKETGERRISTSFDLSAALLCTYMHTYRYQQENVRPSMRRVVVQDERLGAQSFWASCGHRSRPGGSASVCLHLLVNNLPSLTLGVCPGKHLLTATCRLVTSRYLRTPLVVYR